MQSEAHLIFVIICNIVIIGIFMRMLIAINGGICNQFLTLLAVMTVRLVTFKLGGKTSLTKYRII